MVRSFAKNFGQQVRYTAAMGTGFMSQREAICENDAGFRPELGHTEYFTCPNTVTVDWNAHLPTHVHCESHDVHDF